MTPAAAAWVWDNVLTPQLRDSRPIGKCMCELGQCGACDKGDHRRCLTWRRDGHTVGVVPSPAAYLTDRKSLCRGWKMWLVGHPCTYQCACPTCRPTRRRVLPAFGSPGNAPARVKARPQQGTLFDPAAWGLA